MLLRFKNSTKRPYLKFQIVSLGVMTVIVLKTCISFKKFQKPRQVFQTLFRKPKTKQHRASQLTDLSFAAKLGNFRNSCPTRRAKKSHELPLRQRAPMFCNSASVVYTWSCGQAHDLRLLEQVSTRCGGECGLLLVQLDPCFEKGNPTVRRQHKG